MNLQPITSALDKIDNSIDLVCTWVKLQENLKIKIDSGEENDWDTPEELEINQFLFSASFYDAYYSFVVDKKDIENNEVNTWGLEGPSILFASFEEVIQIEKNWEIIKLISKRFEKLSQLECN